ncbi:MAG TPA: sigma-70 family RNA polymerase sigma factor [Tepidisphaeraceae bacterium]|jgi:RNA polymerase sigma-70 factor (ECF subfamily)
MTNASNGSLPTPPAPAPLTLLGRGRSGDAQALGSLLKSYSPYLTLIARMQIGKRLQAKLDEDDVVQETFLEAARQFPNFRGNSEAELTAWLRTILAGQIALALRRYLGTQGRDLHMERELNVQLDQSSRMLDRGLVGSGTTPSQNVSRREQSVLLAEALEKLPADYREVIVLRHLEQLSFADVSAKMNRSVDSVQKLWVRGLKLLRESMVES